MQKHELNEFIINLVGVTNGMQIITAVDKYCSASNDGKPLVSGSWSIGRKVEVTGCFHGHDFEIGEIVEIIDHEPTETTSWLCTNGKCSWWLSESEGNCR